MAVFSPSNEIIHFPGMKTRQQTRTGPRDELIAEVARLCFCCLFDLLAVGVNLTEAPTRSCD